MKYYNLNGKTTSAEERRHAREQYRETLFSRLITPQPPSPPSSVASHHRVSLVPSGATNSTPETFQQSAVRAVSAHASRLVRGRSAKLRARSARVRKSLNSASVSDGHSGSSEQVLADDCAAVRLALESPSDASSLTQASNHSGRSRKNGRSDVPAIEVSPEGVVTDMSEDKRSTNGDVEEEERKTSRTAFGGLRIAVADFTKKVIDNEGMGISTFSYLHHKESLDESHQGDGQLQPENSGMTELQREVSIRSYQRYRSTLSTITPAARFRRAVRTINLLLRACTSHAEETKRARNRLLTFIDYQEEIEDPNNEPTEALFDQSYYKARRERSISTEAKEIMRTHPSLRTEDQIQKVMMSLNSAVEAFGEFPVHMQKSLVRVGWYEKFGPKRVIIRQGHAALNFYFMISGVTMVTVARQKPATGETYAETVAFLKKGNSFGELALMYGGKRSATVSCKDEVELLAVAREDFVDIFMSMETETEPEHVRYLRDIPLFEGWPIDSIPYDDPTICLFTYFRRGTVLCRDSKTAEWVYVVMTGRCRVIKDLPSKDAKIQRLKSRDRMLDCVREKTMLETQVTRFHSFMEKDSFMKASSATTRRRDRGRISETESESSKSTEKSTPGTPSKKVYVQLKRLGPKDVFGLESIAFELYGESHSVTLVSDGAECVLINRAFFIKNMKDKFLKKIRRELQPFPSLETLEEKLQASCNWNAYREYLFDHILSRHQYSESTLY